VAYVRALQTAQIEGCASIGLASATLVSRASTALWLSVLRSAMEMASAPTARVIAVKAGLARTAPSPPAPTTATTTASARMANATVVRVLQARTVVSAPVHQGATVMEFAQTTLACAVTGGPASTVLCRRVLLSARVTATATMGLASASPVSLAFTVLCQLAPPPAPATASVPLRGRPWRACVMRDLKVMIVLRSRARTIAVVMVSASMACVHAKMAGVVRIAPAAVLGWDSGAQEMASVLTGRALATLAGAAMAAIYVPAFMTARSTVSVITERAFAKRDTVAATAHFRRSPNLASVPFTACAAACSSAPRSMRRRAPALRTNATRSAHRSAFPSASQVRCL